MGGGGWWKRLTHSSVSQLMTDYIFFGARACVWCPLCQATLDKFRDHIVKSIPLSRIGEPSDVAGVTLFLSSPAGAYLTGTIIPLDGGALIKARL